MALLLHVLRKQKCQATGALVLGRLFETPTTTCHEGIESLQRQRVITLSNFALYIPKFCHISCHRSWSELSSGSSKSDGKACPHMHHSILMKTLLGSLMDLRIDVWGFVSHYFASLSLFFFFLFCPAYK